jgi:hypothetical protein
MPEKRLGFDIEAEFKFSKTDHKLDTEIRSIDLMIGNNIIIPRMTMTFIIDSRYTSMLVTPYTVKLKMTEKNNEDKPMTNMDTEWIVYNQDSTHIRREQGAPKRPEREFITHTYIMKDAYSAFNTEVGGIYEKKKIEDVIKDLWNKTEHGSLQLKMEKLDNTEKYDQIWIPNMKFHMVVNYLAQHYGMFETIPANYCDFEKYYIMSINDAVKQNDDLTFFFDNVKKEDRKGPNQKYYEMTTYPKIENSFNKLIGTIPKKFNVIKPSKTKLYEKEELDVASTVKKMNFISNNDFFDKFLEKETKPGTSLASKTFETYNLKEMISTMATDVVEPVDVTITAPFRLSDFKVCTKVKFEDEKVPHENTNVTFYIDKLRFDIQQDSDDRWDGYIDVLLRATSTKDVFTK